MLFSLLLNHVVFVDILFPNLGSYDRLHQGIDFRGLPSSLIHRSKESRSHDDVTKPSCATLAIYEVKQKRKGRVGKGCEERVRVGRIIGSSIAV